jgi:hypothetical protein
MPEEINRKVTDSITDYFFTTSHFANENLKNEGIDENLKDAWSFALNDNMSFKHMMWRFRHSDDCYRIAFLLGFIRKIYKHSDAKIEKNQIDIAKFLSNYIEIHENDDFKLEQTEQAIDVATAMKIYQSKGLEEVGKQVIANKAGATRVEMNVKSESPAQPK